MSAWSKWKGTIVGALIGLLLRRPHFVIIGAIIGQLYDRGVFGGRKAAPAPADDEAPDAYAVLGVPVGASQDEIEQAYRKRMSEYHPDKVATAAPELKALAERRAREINAAYERIQKRRNNR